MNDELMNLVISRAPFRVSLAGGGTDFKDFYSEHGGLVVSTTIDKFVYVIVQDSFEKKVIVRYKETEITEDAHWLKHALVRECMKEVGVERNIEITIISQLPTRSGLSGSSALTLALLNALYYFKTGLHLNKIDLAEMACRVEIDRCKAPIGKQDQYAQAFGGMNILEFCKSGVVTVTPAFVSPAKMAILQNNLMLFWVGRGETRGYDILQNRKYTPENIQHVFNLKTTAEKIASWLQSNDDDIKTLADVFNSSYYDKIKSGAGGTDKYFQECLETGIGAGAIGGKMNGSGRGFMILCVPEKRKPNVRNALSHLIELPFRFSREGTEIVKHGNIE